MNGNTYPTANATVAAVGEVLDYFPGPDGAVHVHLRLANGRRVGAAARDITLTVPVPLLSDAA